MKKIILSFVLIAGILTACNKDENFLPYADQLALDTTAIDNYLDSHGINALKDSSGLRYVVKTLGSGIKPGGTESRVYIRQVIKTLDGTTIGTDTTGNFYTLGTLLQGKQIGLKLMPKGSNFTLYVPSGLAYGNSSVANVGPNTILVFEMRLLDDDAQLATELAYLDNYLDTVSNVTEDASGLRLVILNEGGQSRPTINNSIVFNYSGKILKTGVSIGSGTNVSAPMINLIEAFQIGMPYIGVGGHVRMYVPSKLAYGFTGSNPAYTPVIPPNSILYYDVTLNAF